MPTFPIPANVTSRPHFVPAGAIVKVSPASGASATVEYTSGGPIEIANNVATWAAWPKGAVSAETSDLANNPTGVRITAIGGDVVLSIELNPGADKLRAFRTDWGKPSVGSTSAAPGLATGSVIHRPAGATVQFLAVAGSTWANMIGCKSSFQGVRIMYANYDTVNPLTITAKAAATSKLAEDGRALTYTNVTFGGQASVTIPVATGTSPNVIPSYVISDVLPISSVARSDLPNAINSDYLLYMRLTSPQDIPVISMKTLNQGWIDTTDYIAGVRWATDQVTNTATTALTPNTGTGGNSGQVNIPYSHVEFFTGGKVAPVIAFGDSLTNGAPDCSQAWPISCRKYFTAAGNANMMIGNHGTTGQKRDVSSQIFQAYAALAKPRIAVIWNYSVNSPGGGTAQLPILQSDLEFCRKNGIYPVVVTMHPDDANAAWTRQYLSGWGTLIDAAKLLRTSASVATILPANTTDGTHLTQQGCDLVAAEAAAKILALL